MNIEMTTQPETNQINVLHLEVEKNITNSKNKYKNWKWNVGPTEKKTAIILNEVCVCV